MRHILSIFLLLFFAQTAAAQYSLRVQANAAALRTHLNNATDNASDLVTSSPKITPNGGLTLSWVKPDKNGFQGWRVGLDYLWYRQNTEGGYWPPADPNYRPTGFTTSSLHYLNVPVEARFGLAGKRGILPFATVGVYGSALITYTETKSQTFGDINTPGRSWVINTEISGKNFSFDNDPNNFQGLRKTEIIEGIYRPLSFGLMGSIGFEVYSGKQHFFSFRIPVRYGLIDVERKREMKFSQTSYDPTLDPSSAVYAYYWDYNSPKGVPFVQSEKRSATHPFSYGLELSYGFRFIPKKRS